MLKRLRGAAIAVSALVITSGVLYAAGNYSTYPIVGEPSFCISVVSGAGGYNAQGNVGGAGATGQGQALSGSLCAQTVPAGPPIVTGNELIPADTGAGVAGGASPQTVVLTLGSLNALPLSVTTILTTATNSLTATNITGGFILHSSAAASPTTIYLPAAPIDGQQFVLSSDQTIASLTVTSNSVGRTISNNPTALTVSTTAAYGYKLSYNVAANGWFRLQ